MLAVCCGMIRSGSTLQYNLVRNLVEATDMGRGVGFIGNPSQDDRLRPWSQDSAWRVVKMHHVADWMFEEQARTSIRFFFSHRDLRDVAASAKRKFGWPSPQVWQAIDAAIGLQRRLQDLPEAQIHRYADLSTDPSTVLAAIAKFLGLPLGRDVATWVLSACSLNNAEKIQAAIRDIMSAKGVSIGEGNKAPIYDQTTLLHHNHISSNSGQDGAWQHDLTEDDLRTISGRYQRWQQNEGYGQVQYETE